MLLSDFPAINFHGSINYYENKSCKENSVDASTLFIWIHTVFKRVHIWSGPKIRVRN